MDGWIKKEYQGEGSAMEVRLRVQSPNIHSQVYPGAEMR